MLEKHFTKLVAEMVSTSSAFPQLVELQTVHKMFAELNICKVGEVLNQEEILKRLTQKFSVGIKMGAQGQELNCDEEKLSVIKSLFRQIIDTKIGQQLQEIDNRKQTFMNSFKQELIRKMTVNKAGNRYSKTSGQADSGNQDNAMSVDGDVSYCSVEMDETDKAQQLKFREANGSLHLVEKQDASIHMRHFVVKKTL